MNRLFFIAALSAIAAGGALAGPIAVNLSTAGTGGTSILNKNLAANGYLPCTSGTNSNGEACTTSNTTTTPIPSGLPTGFSTVLFNGVQVPFDIASGGTNAGNGVGDTNNIWAPGNAAGGVSKVIDVGTYTGGSDTSGVFGVDQIWTLLNDWYATAGYQGITLTLNGYQADGVTPITENIYLTAGVDYRSIGGNTNPQDVTVCDVANIGAATLGTNCTNHTSTTTPSVGTDSSYNSSNVANGVSVTVYNDVYATQDTLTPTPDNYWLDAQNITLGSAFLNGWLNTVTVTSNNGTGMQEKVILSALTVDSTTSSTPEPGTILLLSTGLAAVALFQVKRSKKV
jgi:hypothetical protein